MLGERGAALLAFRRAVAAVGLRLVFFWFGFFSSGLGFRVQGFVFRV